MFKQPSYTCISKGSCPKNAIAFVSYSIGLVLSFACCCLPVNFPVHNNHRTNHYMYFFVQYKYYACDVSHEKNEGHSFSI